MLGLIKTGSNKCLVEVWQQFPNQLVPSMSRLIRANLSHWW